jgi:hypothetical protein
MGALRRTLYLEAAAWAIVGTGLAAAPRFVVNTVGNQPSFPDDAWLRIVGVQALGLAMLMVLVAHRLEELWWWSWAFALVTALVGAVAILNAAFGLAPRQSSVLWWVFAGVSLGFAYSLLYGLYLASRERPLP